MKIIISPAKKMEECADLFEPGALPEYLERTKLLLGRLSAMTEAELKALFRANDSITHLNYLRYRDMDPGRAQTPALLSYVGIQYQYMAPKLFSYSEWEYVKEHLRILSGFYGILRPDDRIVPYRLEMQAKLAMPAERGTGGSAAGREGTRDLYEFWGDLLLRALVEDEDGDSRSRRRSGDCGGRPEILNLASKEYSRAVEPYLTPEIRYVTCVFGTAEAGSGTEKVKVRATEAKMARGEMVRYLAQNRITDADGAKGFDRLGYVYREDLSETDRFVFTR